MSLDELRKRIADLDERILDLVSERMEVAREVGEIKSREEVPIRNYPVEARVMERFLEGSSRRGIEAELGSGLASLLIDQAVRLQSGYRDMSFKKGSGRVLVAGGKGKMGRWLCDFFHAQGYQVEVSDPVEGKSEYPLRDDFARAASEADLVILSVPILEIESMLRSLDPGLHDCMILDISSLKTPIIEPLREAASRGLRVASIHPMFGPDAVHLIGRNIVFCDCGNALALAEAKQLFVDLGANLVELSLEEHDRRIGYVLGLAHLVNILFFRTLSASGLDYGDLGQVASTTFQKQIESARDVARENPGLYFEIQCHNAETPAIADNLRGALDELLESVASGDLSRFEKLMESGRDFFLARPPLR